MTIAIKAGQVHSLAMLLTTSIFFPQANSFLQKQAWYWYTAETLPLETPQGLETRP
jgi:hypothetical protein